MTTITSPATDPKTITYDRQSRDFRAEYDGVLVGYYPSFHAAEEALDDYAYDLLSSAENRTTAELDGQCGSCGAPFNDYGQCEVCAEPFICAACRTDKHAPSALQSAVCTECVQAMLRGYPNRLVVIPDDRPIDSPGDGPSEDEPPGDWRAPALYQKAVAA